MIIHPNKRYKQKVDPPAIPTTQYGVRVRPLNTEPMTRLRLWNDAPIEPDAEVSGSVFGLEAYDIPVVQDPYEIRSAPTYTYTPTSGSFRCGCSECTTIRRQRELEHNEY